MEIKCPDCGKYYSDKYFLCPDCKPQRSPIPQKMPTQRRTPIQSSFANKPSFMRIPIAIILGLFSGFLIYFGSAMIFMDIRENLSPFFVLITFFGGWIFASFLMIKGTRTVSKVFIRGFLIGAAEWLAMIPIGFIFGAKTISETGAKTGPELIGATIGGGIFSFLTSGLAGVMSVICMLGFFLSYFIGREMKPEYAGNTKKCPQCAEMIKPEAAICRYCGYHFT